MADPEKEQELKQYFFKEYSLLMNQRAETQRVYEKFIKERSSFNEDMKAMNSKILFERKRLKEESALFDKKLSILQNAFMQLDLEKKQLEKDKREFEQKRSKRPKVSYGKSISSEESFFFAGVNNPMALKKRYKDLLKIFHPDNLAGDDGAVKAINEEYERIKNSEF